MARSSFRDFGEHKNKQKLKTIAPSSSQKQAPTGVLTKLNRRTTRVIVDTNHTKGPNVDHTKGMVEKALENADQSQTPPRHQWSKNCDMTMQEKLIQGHAVDHSNQLVEETQGNADRSQVPVNRRQGKNCGIVVQGKVIQAAGKDLPITPAMQLPFSVGSANHTQGHTVPKNEMVAEAQGNAGQSQPPVKHFRRKNRGMVIQEKTIQETGGKDSPITKVMQIPVSVVGVNRNHGDIVHTNGMFEKTQGNAVQSRVSVNHHQGKNHGIVVHEKVIEAASKDHLQIPFSVVGVNHSRRDTVHTNEIVHETREQSQVPVNRRQGKNRGIVVQGKVIEAAGRKDHLITPATQIPFSVVAVNHRRGDTDTNGMVEETLGSSDQSQVHANHRQDQSQVPVNRGQGKNRGIVVQGKPTEVAGRKDHSITLVKPIPFYREGVIHSHSILSVNHSRGHSMHTNEKLEETQGNAVRSHPPVKKRFRSNDREIAVQEKITQEAGGKDYSIGPATQKLFPVVGVNHSCGHTVPTNEMTEETQGNADQSQVPLKRCRGTNHRIVQENLKQAAVGKDCAIKLATHILFSVAGANHTQEYIVDQTSDMVKEMHKNAAQSELPVQCIDSNNRGVQEKFIQVDGGKRGFPITPVMQMPFSVEDANRAQGHNVNTNEMVEETQGDEDRSQTPAKFCQGKTCGTAVQEIVLQAVGVKDHPMTSETLLSTEGLNHTQCHNVDHTNESVHATNGNADQSQASTKRRRGKNRGMMQEKIRCAGDEMKMRVDIDPVLGRPTNMKQSRHATSIYGIAAREIVTMTDDWRLQKESDLKLGMEYIKSKLNIEGLDTDIQKQAFISSSLGRIQRNARYALKKDFFARGDDAKPPKMSWEQWRAKTSHWMSPEYQAKCAKAKMARSMVKSLHRSGPIPFVARRAAIEENEGNVCGPIRLWKETHFTPDPSGEADPGSLTGVQGRWASDGAEEIYRRMLDARAKVEAEGQPVDEQAICNEITMPNGRTDYMIGVGYGPKPVGCSKRKGAGITKNELAEALRVSKEMHEKEVKDLKKQQREQNWEAKKEMMHIKKQMSKFQAFYDLFTQLASTSKQNPMAQLLASMSQSSQHPVSKGQNWQSGIGAEKTSSNDDVGEGSGDVEASSDDDVTILDDESEDLD